MLHFPFIFFVFCVFTTSNNPVCQFGILFEPWFFKKWTNFPCRLYLTWHFANLIRSAIPGNPLYSNLISWKFSGLKNESVNSL